MTRDSDIVFEEMLKVINLSVKERWSLKILPLGKNVYNGFGYIMPDKDYWTDCVMEEMEEWSKDYGIKFDGPVIVFPDEDTVVLFKLRWC